MSNVTVDHQRRLLVATLDSINVCNDRETELLHELKVTRERRSVFDSTVQQLMVECEEARLSSDDFQVLLNGIRHQVATALTRHSLRGM